jgi:hypothetical protein
MHLRVVIKLHCGYTKMWVFAATNEHIAAHPLQFGSALARQT